MRFLHVEGKRVKVPHFLIPLFLQLQMEKPQRKTTFCQYSPLLILEPFSVVRRMGDWPSRDERLSDENGVLLKWGRKVHSSSWRGCPTWTKTTGSQLSNVLLFELNLTSIDIYCVSRDWHWRLGMAKVWDPISRSWDDPKYMMISAMQTSGPSSNINFFFLTSKTRPIPLLSTLTEFYPFP